MKANARNTQRFNGENREKGVIGRWRQGGGEEDVEGYAFEWHNNWRNSIFRKQTERVRQLRANVCFAIW